MKRYGGRAEKALGWFGGLKKIMLITKLIRMGWRELVGGLREGITADPWIKLCSRLGSVGAHKSSLP